MKKTESSLKTIACQEILNGIIMGEYQANQIINEQELVDKFGFSKTPIREALATLCNEGVLRNLPRCGYEVVQLTRRDITEALDFRYVIEGGFLRQSYQTITEEQLEHLYELNELCKSPTGDAWDHWEHNANFHITLLSYAGNDYACNQLKKSIGILKRAYVQLYRDKWGEALMTRGYHDNMLNSIKAKDIDTALEYLRQELTDY